MVQHFLCYRRLQSSCAVNHAVNAYLSNDVVPNLVVAHPSSISIYDIEQDSEGLSNLQLVGTFPVAGIIESMEVVRLESGMTAQGLLLSFKNYKISLVSYDRSTSSLKTLSLHNFEEASVGLGTDLHGNPGGLTQFSGLASVPIVKIDPKYRCAAMMVYNDQLAILPFRQPNEDMFDDPEHEEENANMDENSSVIVADKIAHEFSDTSAAEEDNFSVVHRPYLILLSKIGVHGTIRDIAFLDMYLEPTLMILHSPKDTCTGRLAALKDNCVITVLSLNLSQRLHPKIWSVDSLPYDSFALSPVPEPIGGAFVLSLNALFYFNQSQYRGLALNGFANHIVNIERFPLQENWTKLNFTIDAARVAHLAPGKMLMSLKNGDLYLLKFATGNNLDNLLSMNLLGSSVLSTCICIIPMKNLFFLGSHLGDSLLISYVVEMEKQQQLPLVDTSHSDLASSTQIQSVSQVSLMSSCDDDAEEEDDEDFLLYGSRNPPQEQKNIGGQSNDAASSLPLISDETLKNATPQYTFSVSDSIVNVGSIVSLTWGKAACLDENGLSCTGSEYEIVGACGKGKNGSLVAYHYGLRPIITTEADLEGCRAMWTVKQDIELDENSMNDKNQKTIEKMDAFLVLSLGSSTMILATGEEMEPIDSETGFFTSGATLGAGNLFNGKRIVQVYHGGIRILEGTSCTQELLKEESLDTGGLGMENSSITLVDILDPYVLLCLNDGSIRLVCGDLSDMEVTAEIPNIVQCDDAYGGITAASLFYDTSDVFSCTNNGDEGHVMEDVESLQNETHFKKISTSTPVLCAISRESGTVQIYTIPEFTMLREFKNLAYGFQILDSVDESVEKSKVAISPIADLLIHHIGSSYSKRKMVIIAYLANGDLLLYIAKKEITTNQYLFHRVSSEIILRPFTATAPRQPTAAPSMLRTSFRYPMLTKFNNVGGRSGAFFRGIRPAWIICDRGQFQIIPMSVSSIPNVKITGVPVLSFTPFHNTNCPNGFIYYFSPGLLRICQLPSTPTVNIGSSTLCYTKIPLKCTPHAVAYLGSKGMGSVGEALQVPTYAVLVSKSVKSEPDDEIEEPLDEEPMEKPVDLFETINESDIPDIMEEEFELRLIRSNDWKIEGVFHQKLERYEYGLSMQVAYLSDSAIACSNQNGNNPIQDWKKLRKPHLLVGTGFVAPEGEDIAGRGRILLYEVDYAQYTSETGEVGEKVAKLKLVYSKEHKQGAVSKVAQMGPYLLAAVGSKIIVYEYKNEQLSGCAFYDAQVYIVSLTVVKDFVMYGDVYKSIHFLRWKERERSLTLLAKDYDPLPIYSSEFSIDDHTLGLVAADARQNLNVFHFAPQDVKSRGGQRLLCRADFHLGAHVSTIHRHRIPQLFPNHRNNKFVNLFGCLDGSLGYIVPVAEGVYRRLFTLQTIMVNALPQNCGMNPRAFRQYLHGAKQYRSSKKNVLDGDVLWRFCTLDVVTQRELARAIGTTTEIVLHNLLEIDLAISFL